MAVVHLSCKAPAHLHSNILAHKMHGITQFAIKLSSKLLPLEELEAPEESDTGEGKTSPGDNFNRENCERGKLRHTSNFGAGPSDTGGENFVRGKFRHTPNPWFLVDNQLCATLAGPDFEHHQLNRGQKRARPRLALHTEGGTVSRKRCDESSFLRSTQFPTLRVVPK